MSPDLLSVLCTEMISSDEGSRDISDTLKLLSFVKKMRKIHLTLEYLKTVLIQMGKCLEMADPDIFSCFWMHNGAHGIYPKVSFFKAHYIGQRRICAEEIHVVHLELNRFYLRFSCETS